jgi:hypothetical protein
LVVQVAMAQESLGDIAFKNGSWKDKSISLGKRASHVEKEIIPLVFFRFLLIVGLSGKGGLVLLNRAPSLRQGPPEERL